MTGTDFLPHIINMETQNTAAEATGQAAEETTPQPPRKRNRTLLITLIVLVVVLIGGGIGFYFMHAANASEKELAAYESLEDDYNTADYEAFLDDYPESEYADEVEKRLKQLQNMEQAWSLIDMTGTQSDFVDFKNRFRDARYDKLCDGKIDSLDWMDAQRLNTQAAYQTYLDMHPGGRYASEAAIAQSTTQNLTVSVAEREAVTQAVAGFFSAFSRNDEAAICSYIPPVMDTFLSKQGATKADVVSTIGNMFNEHILGCTFTVNDDYQISKLPSADGTFSYKATFSVDQRIERNNAGKTFGSYKAAASLNDQFKLTSLTLNEVSRIDHQEEEKQNQEQE